MNHTHTETCEWRSKGASSNGRRYCLTLRRERERVGVGLHTPAPAQTQPRTRLRSSVEGNCSGSIAQVAKFTKNPSVIVGRKRFLSGA